MRYRTHSTTIDGTIYVIVTTSNNICMSGPGPPSDIVFLERSHETDRYQYQPCRQFCTLWSSCYNNISSYLHKPLLLYTSYSAKGAQALRYSDSPKNHLLLKDFLRIYNHVDLWSITYSPETFGAPRAAGNSQQLTLWLENPFTMDPRRRF